MATTRPNTTGMPPTGNTPPIILKPTTHNDMHSEQQNTVANTFSDKEDETRWCYTVTDIQPLVPAVVGLWIIHQRYCDG